uniref:Uncharacterized protein n=1 Tax=Romanomermis culicivorax TaxID=13658 RepID=A0A915JYZ3_ROMCU
MRRTSPPGAIYLPVDYRLDRNILKHCYAACCRMKNCDIVKTAIRRRTARAANHSDNQRVPWEIEDHEDMTQTTF